MKTVITRIAPSPTGDMHIGTARTALFNYLYARHMGGKFLLRIEDTDKERSTPEAVKTILDGLEWLGLDYDGDIVYQSSREKNHIDAAYALLNAGHAYRCYMSTAEANEWKAANKNKAFRSKYRDSCVLLPEPFVIRFKAPVEGETVIHDLVKGEVRFSNEVLDDLVLLRSDGSPTYNLAVVVDDHDSGVNVVIRGDDHLNNTPRQTLIYKALGWDVPEFAHLPLIYGEDSKKYSKRHGAASVMDFAEAGYLPETMRNYLARLGWGHGDADIFSDKEAIEWFDVKNVVSSPARFDKAKLNSMNQHYIGIADNNRLLVEVLKHLEIDDRTDPTDYQHAVLLRALPLLKPAAKTIPELAKLLTFVLRLPDPFEDKALKVLADDATRTWLLRIASELDTIPTDKWVVDDLNHTLRHFAEAHGISMGKIGPAIRSALTGSTTAPDLGTCLVAIGQSESIRRILEVLK